MMVKFKYALPAALLAVAVLAVPAAMADMSEHGQCHEQHQDMTDRITRLHDALKLTAPQEEQWKPVAAIMADNAKTMQDMFKSHHGKAEDMNALEVLALHSEAAQAHAAGVKKLADAFGQLYPSLSPEQKTVADKFFHHGKHHDKHHGEQDGDHGHDHDHGHMGGMN